MKIGHIGDFSVSNWGDRLYPKTLRALLSETGASASVDCFAPLNGSATAGIEVLPLSRVGDAHPELVMVGGGDLVRFDTRTVAMDHMSVQTLKRRSVVNRLRAKIFARKNFLPGPGVWVPQEPWVRGVPSVLISMGVHTIPDTPAARAAINLYTAAWVRTHAGADRLVGAGVPSASVITAPDMIFALPELGRREETAAAGRRILSDRGFTELPFLFHAVHFHGWDIERIVRALKAIAPLPIATLALGSYSGEDKTLKIAADRAGVRALTDLEADEITSVIAAAPGLFTTSMHAAIVGSSFGVPVLFPGTGKTNEAFAVCPVPPRLHVVDDDTLASEARQHFGKRHESDSGENRDAVVSALRKVLSRVDQA